MLEFLEVSFMILLATISPGPDFTIVSRNALRYNCKTGMMTALGIACGTLFHSVYCILGFAIIISRSLLLFNIIKYVGAAYLIYLGVKGLCETLAPTQTDVSMIEGDPSGFQAFRQGLFCTTLNPKAILFFIAFFTIIIKPTMPIYLQSTYAFEIALIDMFWFSAVAFFFSHDKIKAILGTCLHYVTKFFGGFLILFGLKIAVLSGS